MSAQERTPKTRSGKWKIAVFLFVVAVLFYISIMYKIVHFGA